MSEIGRKTGKGGRKEKSVREKPRMRRTDHKKSRGKQCEVGLCQLTLFFELLTLAGNSK